jgi:hypothetical protein
MIKIGLRPREMQVLSDAVNAWSLSATGTTSAAPGITRGGAVD